jgi:DNA-binding transcriptional MocR family regulator
MLPDALEKACIQHEARLVYLNPTLQNPTTVTMPAQRRKEIAAIATRCGIRIIEDDPYWLFAESAPPPLSKFAPDHSYYVSTLSKCLTPGLRVAFVVLKDALERQRFISALRSFALMAAPLTTALATQWIFDGSARQLFEGVKEEARVRHDLGSQLLTGRPNVEGSGLHIWLTLPSYWTSADLARTAVAEGLAVTPAEVFSTPATAPNAIRISLGSMQDRKRLSAGLRRLSQLLARVPRSLNDSVI